MTLHTLVTATVKNNSQQQERRGILSPPGKRWRRLLEHIWIRLVIFLSLYRGGLDFLKAMVARCPKVNLIEPRSDHVCVITGGTRGIGLEIVKILLQLDFTVVMGVRNVPHAEKTMEDVQVKTGKYLGQLRILHLDLKSLRSVRQFASEVLALPEATRIDLLINNAGIFQYQYEVTEDDIECHFQVNYLSHFLLTNLLLPRIKVTAEMKRNGSLTVSPSSSSCHIINTSSRFHWVASLEFNNLAKKNMYESLKCYCDTKLCQIMHAKSIQNQLFAEGVTNIHMIAVHPGDIPSDIWPINQKIESLFRPLLETICRSKEDGANIILYTALDPKFSEVSGGKYFEADKVTKPHPQALDEKIRGRLWEISMELIRSSATPTVTDLSVY